MPGVVHSGGPFQAVSKHAPLWGAMRKTICGRQRVAVAGRDEAAAGGGLCPTGAASGIGETGSGPEAMGGRRGSGAVFFNGHQRGVLPTSVNPPAMRLVTRRQGSCPVMLSPPHGRLGHAFLGGGGEVVRSLGGW